MLKARVCDPHLRNGFRSGGRSLSGIEQRVVSDASYWEVAVSGIKISKAEEALAYRAMIARLRDGEPMIMQVCDAYRPLGSKSSSTAVSLAASAALRATQVALNVTGAELMGGHYFSIGERLHQVKEVVSGPVAPPFLNQLATDSPWDDRIPWADAVAGTSLYTVTITPPLRAAAAAGTGASLSNLVLRCVLRDAADGDLELDLGRLGSPSLALVEDF
ncbi:hypothetical protein IED13_15500 [Bosea sp. SSUT16]|uniref:Uncharacterized protein n=1 Tax=Bosea spartocytisi TaxID=2773451 RepID=A0A927EE96_9HYPH|nr:hypothetical protein [Bosea spartocytisi]MBD3847114.1 hypothetical protein [Bosea spartocytisi]MCT4474190.1 hypothetical protein [Bosea spartocytisi]